MTHGLALLWVALLAPAAAMATQDGAGSIYGTVTDPSGAVVVGATVASDFMTVTE